MKVFDVVAAKRAYAEGRNVTELLRAQQGGLAIAWTPTLILALITGAALTRVR